MSKTPISDEACVDAGWIIASHSNGDFVSLETARFLENAAWKARQREAEQLVEIKVWQDRADTHEQNYKEMLKRIDVLVLEKKELSDYADKLAAGLPEGMLPMDIENIREANAQLLAEVEKQKTANKILFEGLMSLAPQIEKAARYQEAKEFVHKHFNL